MIRDCDVRMNIRKEPRKETRKESRKESRKRFAGNNNVFSPQALKSRAHNLQPTIRIGKNGLTDAIIDEMKCQLKKRKLVKVKVLKSFAEGMDRTALAKEIAMKTGAKVVHHVGFVLTLHKP